MTRPRDRSCRPASTLQPRSQERDLIQRDRCPQRELRDTQCLWLVHALAHSHSHSRTHTRPHPDALRDPAAITSSSPASSAVHQGCGATPPIAGGRCPGAHTPPAGPRRCVPAKGHTLHIAQLQLLLMRHFPKRCSNLVNDGFISAMSRANVVFLACFDVARVKKIHAKLIYSAGIL